MKDSKKNNKFPEHLRLDHSFEKGVNYLDRVIQITGEIGEDVTFDWLDAALCELERDTKKTVTLKIFSGGGSVYDALAMVGRLKASRCHIVTEGYGAVMSAATLLLACGNFRKISEYCQFMHHSSTYGVHGRHDEVKAEVENAEREERLWAHWMAKFSTQDEQFWYNHGKNHNMYLSAEQVLVLGVVDAII